MLFDTHAHMDDRAFDEDRQTLLASLPGQGIGLLMNPGCSLASSRRAVETAAAIPLERIVLETDCPYMSPEPFRGKRNDPGRLYRMAERLAEIRGLPLEEIHRITFENGKRLYRI